MHSGASLSDEVARLGQRSWIPGDVLRGVPDAVCTGVG